MWRLWRSLFQFYKPIPLLIVGGLFSGVVYASEFTRMPITSEEVQINLDIVWICIATGLIFFMKAGFSMVEIGFTRSKNAVNAIMKNVVELIPN